MTESLAHAQRPDVYDGSDNWKQNYVFGPGIDHVLALEQPDVLDFDGDLDTGETTRSFYHRNALGSVMEITDMDEGVVASYRYDPYGALTITVGGQPEASDPLGQRLAFTSRFSDEETGLYYYRARYYSPDTGRFLQRDALSYQVGPCLYEYANSRPPCARDPLGLSPTEGPLPQPSSPRGASAGSGPRSETVFEWILKFSVVGQSRGGGDAVLWAHVILDVHIEGKRSRQDDWEEIASPHLECYDKLAQSGRAYASSITKDFVFDNEQAGARDKYRGYCAVRVRAIVRLQVGKLEGEPTKGQTRVYVAYEADGIVGDTPDLVDPDELDFSESSIQTTYETEYGWDYCPMTRSERRCDPSGWRSRPTHGRDDWKNLTPPPAAPVTEPPRPPTDNR